MADALLRQLRIAILGDTHMPRRARALPGACEAAIREADLTIHTGDFVDNGVLALVEAMANHLVAVHGNVDSPELRERLPERTVAVLGGVRIGLIHDAGRRQGRLERMRRAFPEADAVVFGHSHLPLHESDGGFQIFNPGSPTDPRRAPQPTMGIATVVRGELIFELLAVG